MFQRGVWRAFHARGLRGLTALGSGVAISCAFNAAASSVSSTESSRKVLSWGSNQFGQLGIGSEINAFLPTPLDVSGEIIQVAAGDVNGALVTAGGDVFTWGKGQEYVLGSGDDSSCSSPKLVDVGAKVVSLACSGSHCVAITNQGTVYSWGSQALGRPGPDGTPRQIVGLEGVKQVACGRAHSLAVTAGGLYAWGKGYEGALGTGLTVDHVEPILISVPNTTIVQVAAGNGFSVLLSDKGEVFTCGIGEFGQTAQGSSKERYTRVPTLVRSLNSKKVIHVAAGTFHAACCTEDGEVYTWGLGLDGQIGNGSASLHNTTPQHVNGILKGQKVCEVSCGTGHTAARTKDGKLFIWGRGRDGQLGQKGALSPAARREQPVEVGVSEFVSQVSLGGGIGRAHV